jgi:phosphate starvation-inducible PhoH-like protein
VVRHPLVARIVDAYEAQGSAPMRAGISTRRKTLDNDD